MKSNIQRSLMITAAVLTLSSLAEGAQQGTTPPQVDSSKYPSHLLVPAFKQFVKDVAEEKYTLNYETKGERRSLKAENTKGDQLIGLFPADTKLTQALAFLEEVAATDKYPVEFTDAEGGAKFNGSVVDTVNNRFVITSITPPPLQAAVPMSQGKKEDPALLQSKLEQRLKNFAVKAAADTAEAAKRFENCARKAGKDAEAVCRSLRFAFGGKK